MPLRFAHPLSPSVRVEDMHFQAIEHARPKKGACVSRPLWMVGSILSQYFFADNLPGPRAVAPGRTGFRCRVEVQSAYDISSTVVVRRRGHGS